MIKLEGSKFEPSIFYLLESKDVIFLKKNKIPEIFFTSSPARLAVNIGDPSPFYIARSFGLEVKTLNVVPFIGHLTLAFFPYRNLYLYFYRNKYTKYNFNREKMHGSKLSNVFIRAYNLIQRPASPSINIIDEDE